MAGHLHGARDDASGRKPQHKPHHGKKRFGASIGITKFATAGSKQYDKREKQEKERALNAAKVNAYRKLKKRLGDKMEPRSLPTHAQDPLGEEEAQQAQQQRAPVAKQHRAQQDAAAVEEQQQEQPQQEQQQQQQAEQHAPLPSQEQQWRQAGGKRQGRGGGEGGAQHSGGGRHGGSGKQHKPLSHVQRIAADVQAQKEVEKQQREERQRLAAERRAKLAADAKQRAAKSKQLFKKTSHGQPVMKYRVEKMLAQLEGGA